MTKSEDMQRLEAVLSVYGADPTRWPAEGRAQLKTLIARDPHAAALMAEEAAFDGVLGSAPAALAMADVQGAKDRLFACFEAENNLSGAAVTPAATVVPFAKRTTKPAASVPAPGIWREVSVMAASLLIGFFTVSQGFVDVSRFDLSPLGATASLSASDTDDVSAIAFGTNGDEVSVEDLL